MVFTNFKQLFNRLSLRKRKSYLAKGSHFWLKGDGIDGICEVCEVVGVVGAVEVACVVGVSINKQQIGGHISNVTSQNSTKL